MSSDKANLDANPLYARVSEEQREIVERAARSKHLLLSAYVRMAVLERAEQDLENARAAIPSAQE